MTVINANGLVKAWLDGALASQTFQKYGFQSIHVDDLYDGYTDDDAVSLGFQLFDALVIAYADMSTDVMAWLAISTGHSNKINLAAPAASALNTTWDRWTPPELYIQKRAPLLEPYFVEEYKKPYPPGAFTAPQGVYHAYYRCHRQDSVIEFTSTIHIEHYPTGSPR